MVETVRDEKENWKMKYNIQFLEIALFHDRISPALNMPDWTEVRTCNACFSMLVLGWAIAADLGVHLQQC